MKNKTLRGLLRLAAFGLCFVPVLLFANTFLIKTDTYARLTLAEMKQRSDIDMVFVGSSIVRDHFNAEMITKETGLESFSLGIPCAALQADLAMTKEFYRTNHPEWTVLVVEPFTFDTVKEGIEAQYELMPYLSSPVERVKYYLNLCREDGWYLDRLCMFRDFAVDSFSDFTKTVGLHFWPFETYEKLKPKLDKRMSYEGRGFVRYNTKDRAKKTIRQQIIREYTGYYYDLFPRSKEMLLEYRNLVARNGSKLLVFIYPNLTVHNLAIPGFLDYNEALMRFCKENDIECVNFSLARLNCIPARRTNTISTCITWSATVRIFSATASPNSSTPSRRAKTQAAGSIPESGNTSSPSRSSPTAGFRLTIRRKTGTWPGSRTSRPSAPPAKTARGTCIWPTATTDQASRRNTASSFATNPRERKPR